MTNATTRTGLKLHDFIGHWNWTLAFPRLAAPNRYEYNQTFIYRSPF